MFPSAYPPPTKPKLLVDTPIAPMYFYPAVYLWIVVDALQKWKDSNGIRNEKENMNKDNFFFIK